MDFDTKYHMHNHTPSSLKQDINIDICDRLLDSLSNENVINQIINNLIQK